MENIRQYLGFCIAGALLFFLIKPFVETYTDLRDVTFQIQWQWLIFSFALLLFYRSIYTYPFGVLLGSLMQKQVTFRTVFTLFHLSNITRYLPGRVWGIVRLLSLSQRFGLRKTAVGASLTLHVSIETALGGVIAIPLLFSTQVQDTVQGILEKISGHSVLLTLAGIGLLATILFGVLKMSNHALLFLKTLWDTSTPILQKSFWNQWVNILVIHVSLWMCQGLAFYLFVRSLTSVQWTDAGVLTACYAFAWIVGFLSFLTPGGLGIREGLLGLLLSSYMPVMHATLAALLCRLWMLSAEMVLAGVAFYLNRRTDATPQLFKEKL